MGRDQVNTNMFNYLKSHKNTFLFKLFNLLMSDTDLKEQFKKRYALRLKNDFTEEKLLNSINEFKSSIQSEIKYHINRWRYPSSESECRTYYVGANPSWDANGNYHALTTFWKKILGFFFSGFFFHFFFCEIVVSGKLY